MASLARKAEYALGCQLVFLSATWLAGIYVNGFVPILPGTPAQLVLLNPAVESHIILASLSAATSALIVGLASATGSRRLIGLASLALITLVVAGDSGLAIVLGGGSEAAQSMVMATAFVTALFLTFFVIRDVSRGDRESATSGQSRTWAAGRAARTFCYLSLVFFYAIFVSGMYVNLFVAGPVFSLPLGLQLAAMSRAEQSVPFVVHEALGGALFVALVILVVSLWAGGSRRLSLVAVVPAALVSYSAYVGSLNLTALAPMGSALESMVSSTGLMAAIILTMLIGMKMGD